ncbi:MAG: outer membrane beta-barrel protein [Bacteroidota bacterium]
MKRIYFISLIVFALSLNLVHSQTNCISKGKSLIDVYYGFPNFYSNIITQEYNNSYDLTRGVKPNYNISGFGPIGLKYEYLLTDEIGLGLNLFYASTSLKWSDATYNYKTTVTRFRAAVTANWHFSPTPDFDPYVMVHLGYANFNYTFDQTSINDSIPAIHPKPDLKFMLPVAMRIGIGARYFFTKNIGINAEVGLGGVVLTGGVSLKF